MVYHYLTYKKDTSMKTREDWLMERKTYIGASEIGSIVGESKWKSALDVYLDKISPDIDLTDSKPMKWGRKLEDLVAQDYAEKTGFTIELPYELGTYPDPIRHPKYPHLAVNLDRWVDNKKFILECKTARFISKEWGQEYTDAVPAVYLCQVAYQLAVCEAAMGYLIPKADIAVLFGGQDDRIYTYERNPDFGDKLIKIADNFWNNNVLKRIPPE